MTDEAESVADRESDRRVLLIVSGVLLTAFAIGAAVQTVFVFRSGRTAMADPLEITLDVGLRTSINVASVALVLVIVSAVRFHERAPAARMLWIAGTAALAAVARFGLQVVTGVYPEPTWEIALTEEISVFAVVVTALALGLVLTDARARLRMQERLSAGQALRAAEALEALASEELRVRREVAESLHGTVQNRLLLAGVELDSIIERRRAGAGAGADAGGDADVEVADLVRLKGDLADIRERDVREMSHLLYPVGVNVGAAHAIRLLVRRIPATIATDVVIDADLAVGDELSVDQRVLLVRAAEEAITNALKHGNAGTLALRLARDTGSVHLSVTDDGVGLTAAGTGGSGLERLESRAGALGGDLSVRRHEVAGTEFRLTLPV